MAAPTSRPLLSASLIVKDEEDMLPRCLAALAGVVDEIVVLDTGSTDRTVEIAEAAGAVVHRAEWVDDFAHSRNQSLSHCTGRWVLIVDADEVVEVDDVAAFRRQLARTADEALTVHVENVADHGGSINFTHDPVRIFRRTRFAWEGRIHERVVSASGRAVRKGACPAMTIRHFGYAPQVVVAKNKVERNVALAEAAWAAAPDDLLARTELVRSLTSTSRYDETIAHLEVMRAAGGTAGHTALNLGVGTLLRKGDLETALAWAEELHALGVPTMNGIKNHGEVLFRLGRYEEALQVLEAVPEDGPVAGVHGTHETRAAIDALRVRTLVILGREDEAADLALAIAPGAPDSHWPTLLTLLHRRGEVARAVPAFFEGLEVLGEARARGVLATLTTVHVEVGDAFFEALAAEPGGLTYALAFVVANAPAMAIDRAASWSSVARAAGLVESCPLLHQVRTPEVPASQRFVAAAMALGTFGDERGREGLRAVAADLAADQVLDALYVMSEIAPDAFVDLVTGYVTTQTRALQLSDALVALGAHEEAVAVLHYGLDECEFDAASGMAISTTLAELELLR